MKSTVRKMVLAVCLATVVLRAETLTIATYNVENYVAAGRRVDGVYRRAYPKPEAAKQALRTVIRELNADVLALQEMGPAPYLQELQRDLRSEGMDYPHAVLAEAADADRHVALLSRRPLSRVETQADLGFKYFNGWERVKRGVLEVGLAAGEGDVTLFVVHLRSRFTERADDPNSARCRAGEAGAIRDFVLRRFPDPRAARFLILGDCNDTKDSKPLRLLRRRGRTVIAELLAAADARGDTWTHTYRKEETYTRVDHILVSPGLASAVSGGRAQIYDGPGGREASDHRPVLVRLEMDKLTPLVRATGTPAR
ncbi:MAG: endonuclease/exonuclease/phosphatase family protein [Opitutaceae bacterium]|nr:endonuclease/exonuclease/phosphatase family protein [Opitutaceae bacterium]